VATCIATVLVFWMGGLGLVGTVLALIALAVLTPLIYAPAP